MESSVTGDEFKAVSDVERQQLKALQEENEKLQNTIKQIEVRLSVVMVIKSFYRVSFRGGGVAPLGFRFPLNYLSRYDTAPVQKF